MRAQQAGSTAESTAESSLQEVIVTGTRQSGLEAAQSPAPIQILSAEALEKVAASLPASNHSFPVPYVRRSSNMVFNLITYQRLLFSDFLAAGGTIEQREFHTPHEFTTLPQKTIVNCPGYGARAVQG